MADSQRLKIFMFGRFEIRFGTKSIDDTSSRSKKMWLLLEYLISCRGKNVSQADIIELLWHDDDEIDDPANTLKTLVHRVRTVLTELGYADGKNMLLSGRGTYCWSPEIPCTVDAEEFEQLCDKAFADTTPSTEALPVLLKAIDLYQGYFLSKNDMEPWVIPLSTYYHTLYQRTVSEAVTLLSASQSYEQIIDVCRKFLSIDQYEESVHYELIRALAASGKYQAALTHYEYVTKLFFTEFGVNPSERLTALYKEVVKTSNAAQLDLNVIKSGLREEDPSAGAYYCEYELFKEIYQIESRAAARTGQSIFLCLFTATSSKKDALPQKTVNKIMEKLCDSIRLSLRRGDVFTRYSVTQYLIMLPTTSFENADLVAKRIIRRFHTDNPRLAVTLKYTAKPLEPSAEK